MNPRKLFIAMALLACMGAFFALDLGQYFSLIFLKDSQASFAALYAARPVAVTLGFFALYVAVTALSLPGALILTLLLTHRRALEATYAQTIPDQRKRQEKARIFVALKDDYLKGG